MLLFEDSEIIPLKIANQSISILSTFAQHTKTSSPTRTVQDPVNKDMLWDFFDGASQRDPPRGSAGGILRLSKNPCIFFSAGIGNKTNNFCEMISLKLTLCLAQGKSISHLHIYGDSLLVIRQMKGT